MGLRVFTLILSTTPAWVIDAVADLKDSSKAVDLALWKKIRSQAFPLRSLMWHLEQVHDLIKRFEEPLKLVRTTVNVALEKLGNHTVTIWTYANMLIGACWLTQVMTNKWKRCQCHTLTREIAAARTWWLDNILQISVGDALIQQLSADLCRRCVA